MDAFFESLTGGAVWGIGFGLAVAAVQSSGDGLRNVAKTALKGGLAATEWVRSTTAEGRESLQDMYHEAKSERRRT